MNHKPIARAADAEHRMSALADQLRAVEQEIEELTGGQVDAVSGEDHVRFLLREAQEKLRLQEVAQRHAAEMQMAIINALPAGSVPTLEEAIRFYPPEYRDEVSRQVKLCAEEGEPFDFDRKLGLVY